MGRDNNGLPAAKTLWLVVFGALTVAAGVIVWLAVGYDRLDGDNQQLAQSVNELREQVIAEGATPVIPQATPGAEPPAPAPQLTDEQVTQAVQAVVAEYELPSRAVVDSLIQAAVARVELIPGPAPTAEQVVAAARPIVKDYLAANPPPAGADGANGADGASGADGADGRNGASIVSAVFDPASCSIIQKISDGVKESTQTFGPLCGRDGKDAPNPFPITFQWVDTGATPLEADRTLRCVVPEKGAVGSCEETPAE